jgi:hypothetical protein
MTSVSGGFVVSRGLCVFCGHDVDKISTAAFPVTGWAVERKAGGTNALIGKRQIPDKIAHAVCAKSEFNKKTPMKGQLSFD